MDPRTRRTVLELLGLGAGAATTGFAAAYQQDSKAQYAVVQGDRCVPVAPISGSEPVEQFYDWAPTPEKRWSSNGTTHLQREDTSIAFLYEGPAATSLVFVHGKLEGDGTGGSVSFTVDGLPRDGEWAVEDDNYDGPNNYDEWAHTATASEIDWTWAGSRTDGGAFRGVSTDDTIRIVPRFNEVAALYGEHYRGDVRRWEFLSGSSNDPDRIELSMDQPLIVGGVDCADDGSTDDGSSGGGHGDDDRDRQESKHEKKQEKHRQKHERTQQKHQAKHEKKQRKHDAKREKKRRKHEAKHQKKQRKHQAKHERKQRKHGD